MTAESGRGMWSGLEGMMYQGCREQIQSRGGGDDSKREAENTGKGIFFVYMCLPLCDDDALCASWRLKRHQRRFDTARKRRRVTEIERGGVGGCGEVLARGVLRFAVQLEGGREGGTQW